MAAIGSLDAHALAQGRHHLDVADAILRTGLVVIIQSVWPEAHAVRMQHGLRSVELAEKSQGVLPG